MAFSMFLRKPACTSRIFSQQVMKLATQPSITQRSVTSSLPIRSLALKDAQTTPLINAVRSFRTSMVRQSAEKAHDHSRLWVIEKAVSAALVPLIPLALLMPNKLFDSALAILVTAHTFWGLEAVTVEYIRVLLFGPLIPKVALGVVYGLSVLLLGGLFYLNFNDIGISRAFWRIWKNMAKPKPVPVKKPKPCGKGLEAIAVDYVRASIFGPVIPKIAIGLVYALCIATLGGLFYVITHDIGVANTFRRIWAIKSDSTA